MYDPGIGATPDLSLRVSVATLVRVVFKHPNNGEWMLAEGPLAYNLEGWTSRNGAEPYEGMLLRGGKSVCACTCSDQSSQLESVLPTLQP